MNDEKFDSHVDMSIASKTSTTAITKKSVVIVLKQINTRFQALKGIKLLSMNFVLIL